MAWNLSDLCQSRCCSVVGAKSKREIILLAVLACLEPLTTDLTWATREEAKEYWIVFRKSDRGAFQTKTRQIRRVVLNRCHRAQARAIVCWHKKHESLLWCTELGRNDSNEYFGGCTVESKTSDSIVTSAESRVVGFHPAGERWLNVWPHQNDSRVLIEIERNEANIFGVAPSNDEFFIACHSRKSALAQVDLGLLCQYCWLKCIWEACLCL